MTAYSLRHSSRVRRLYNYHRPCVGKFLNLCSRCRAFQGVPATAEPHHFLRPLERVELNSGVYERYICSSCRAEAEREMTPPDARPGPARLWRVTPSAD